MVKLKSPQEIKNTKPTQEEFCNGKMFPCHIKGCNADGYKFKEIRIKNKKRLVLLCEKHYWRIPSAIDYYFIKIPND